MMTPWQQFLVQVGHCVAHPRLWHYLLHPLTRYCLAWLVALGGAGAALYYAWTSFDNGARRDGNMGHTTIDFGGQYLMGRMLVRGYGQHLYHRLYQLQALREAYPRADEDPKQEKSDAENLMDWTMAVREDLDTKVRMGAYLAPLAASNGFEAINLAAGDQRVNVQDIGGPLYPPVHAFYYYPLALLEPRVSYHTNQVLGVLLVFVAGLGVRWFSRGRIWWPVAAGFLLAFPGCVSSLNLGQNAVLTLAILIWGWALIARGWPGSGGIIWGLLAFKPVWALSFFLVPLLTRRWRVCVTMVITGAILAALTLPVVGLHSWREWLQIGQEATRTYKCDENWIHLSRDLLSLPRRCLDFGPDPDGQLRRQRQEDVPTAVVGWLLLTVVFEATARVVVLGTLLRRDPMQAPTGPQPAFLFFSAWLCCFHFMYYDTLLAALPVLLLFVDWRRYLQPILVVIMPLARFALPEEFRRYYQPRPAPAAPVAPPALHPGRGQVWVLSPLIPNLTVFLLALYPIFHPQVLDMYQFPYDTICIMVLWLWCGWLCLKPVHRPSPAEPGQALHADGRATPSAANAPKFVQLGADVGGAHERLAHQDRSDAGRL